MADALGPKPQTPEQIAARFKGKGPWKKRLPGLLQMLVALGKGRGRGVCGGVMLQIHQAND